ncbi:MAG: hypothetical protein JJT76_08285 [Clostridiaceae bacterium]|nr:hypothetical protein [Clostridiaceae bacterium]
MSSFVNEKEKGLLKDTGQYNEDNLVKIIGEGLSGEDIYYSYITAIEDGFNLTIEEGCKYIACSYSYFRSRLVDKIPHIRINTTARKLIYLYSKINKDISEDTLALSNKRILFRRDAFFQYIKATMKVKQQYKVFTLNDFDRKTIEAIQANLHIYNSQSDNSKKLSTTDLLSNIAQSLYEVSDPVEYVDNDYNLPEKFYSMKELKEILNLKYDVEVYRLVEKYGTRKYLLCNGDFVRYDLQELLCDSNLTCCAS